MSISDPEASLKITRAEGEATVVDLGPLGPGELTAWAASHRDTVASLLAEHGALLIRDSGIREVADAGPAFAALGGMLLDDEEGFAARQDHGDGVLSSFAWPDDQQMCMHHELSYRLDVPSRVVLACLSTPATGGATGLADAADVLADLPAELVERFAREGWMLVRTYGGDIGPSIEDSFGTVDRSAVEQICRARGVEWEWTADGLRTRQRRAAVVTHPGTGRRLWFNQVAFLSEWTLDPDVREFLVDMNGEEGLPFRTCFGGGEPIGADVIELLNTVYDAHTRKVQWRPGDLLVIDNLATAHSRDPFEGDRELLVGLAGPVQLPLPTTPEDPR